MSEPRFPSWRASEEEMERYRRDYAEWEASPEGVAELARRREAEDKRKRWELETFEREKQAGTARILKCLPERALATLAGQMEMTDAVSASTGATDLLVLSGGPGCGKTVAAAAWVAAFVRDRENWFAREHQAHVAEFCKPIPVWLTAAKLARWERYDDDQMERLLKTPRLVIDDLGGEFMDKAGFYASLLDELINERQAGSKPTIMTTNLDADAFKVRYGERIVDRIREGGRFVLCGNKSMRRKVA